MVYSTEYDVQRENGCHVEEGHADRPQNGCMIH
jgi:hypothetical protein